MESTLITHSAAPTGTSAATPHAAGAAAVFRDSSWALPPGNVYAMLIASGNGPSGFDNTHGGGLLTLEPQGVFFAAQTVVGNGQQVDIPAVDAAGTGNHRFNVAIWWPEQLAVHNDIDVSLVDPNGVVRASSSSVSGVFERLSLTGPVMAGHWTIRVHGFSVPTGTQTVYASWTF